MPVIIHDLRHYVKLQAKEDETLGNAFYTVKNEERESVDIV
jgi:hypothetical protein